uniref:Chitin-binding type-1 domain-containing protein n=1 Tax=Solanum lycopersicum TaxID=4081 RepID=A0A3Q7IUJ4_SOLLC
MSYLFPFIFQSMKPLDLSPIHTRENVESSGYCVLKNCQTQCLYPCGISGWCGTISSGGWEDGGRKCPKGVCCIYSGWCGTTSDYCDVDKCQSQCSGPFPQGRCGWQADNGSCPTGVCLIPEGQCGKQASGRKCPTGVCCSDSGWCGTTSIYCDPNRCQSQCSGPTGVCCSLDGWCGTTPAYCASENCQSQ